MQICTVIKEKVRTFLTDRNKYVLKRDLDDDCDGAHLSSFGIEFLTEVDHQVLPYCVQKRHGVFAGESVAGA